MFSFFFSHIPLFHKIHLSQMNAIELVQFIRTKQNLIVATVALRLRRVSAFQLFSISNPAQKT